MLEQRDPVIHLLTLRACTGAQMLNIVMIGTDGDTALLPLVLPQKCSVPPVAPATAGGTEARVISSRRPGYCKRLAISSRSFASRRRNGH